MSDAENKYLTLSSQALAKFVGKCQRVGIPLSRYQRELAKYAIADAYQDGVIEGLKMADALLRGRMGQ